MSERSVLDLAPDDRHAEFFVVSFPFNCASAEVRHGGGAFYGGKKLQVMDRAEDEGPPQSETSTRCPAEPASACQGYRREIDPDTLTDRDTEAMKTMIATLSRLCERQTQQAA